MASARGELSLIVAKGGQDVGAISSAVFPIIGVVTIVTIFMTPYILKFGRQLTTSLSSFASVRMISQNKRTMKTHDNYGSVLTLT